MSDETKLSGEFWTGVFSPLILVAFVFPLVLLKAWVLTWLWAWYVVPVFGVPPLHLVFAFGLSLTVNYLFPHADNNKKGAELLYQLILSPLIALGLGWVGTWFI